MDNTTDRLLKILGRFAMNLAAGEGSLTVP
jgi:hypothetical protein